MMNQNFEPEVVMPKNDFEAAVIYIAVMAFPEFGAGQIGRPGSNFANALVKYCMWSARQSRGLRWLRNKRNDPHYTAPRKRDFERTLEKGLRRVRRRSAAYSILGSQLLTGFFGVWGRGREAIRAGQPEEAFYRLNNGTFGPAKAHLWREETPSIRQIIASNEQHWSERLALNNTGKAADSRQKAKDLFGRACLSSIPVLHMAHGLETILDEAAKSIEGWEEREPFSALLMNSEKWVWDAIEAAESWRTIHPDLFREFGPDDQVKLILSK